MDISRACRSCLSENSDMYYQIYESARCHNDLRFDWRDYDPTIAEVIMTCTVIKIQPNDGMPQAVCMECLHQAQQAFNFKRICESSDEKLREYMAEHLADVKIEKDSFIEPETIHVSEISVNGYAVSDGEIENESINTDYEDTDEQNDILPDECANNTNSDQEPIEDVEEINVKKATKVLQKDSDENALMKQTQIIDGRYQCVICTKSLKARKSYRLHLRLHIGKNLKQCSVCKRGFAKKSHLNRHLLTHKKIHKCNFCTSAFTTKTDQKEHMKTCSKTKTHQSQPPKNASIKTESDSVESTEQCKRESRSADLKEGDEMENGSEYSPENDDPASKNVNTANRIEPNESQSQSQRPNRSPLNADGLQLVKKLFIKPETIHVNEISVTGHTVSDGEIENESITMDYDDDDQEDDNLLDKYANNSKFNRKPIEEVEKIHVKKVAKALQRDADENTLMEQTQIIDGRYQCVICTKSLKARKTYRLHLRLHIGKNLKQCSFCKRGFAKKSHLDRHLLTHTKIHKSQPPESALMNACEEGENVLSMEHCKRETRSAAARTPYENVYGLEESDEMENSSDYTPENDYPAPKRVNTADSQSQSQRTNRIPFDAEELKLVKSAKQIDPNHFQCPLCSKIVVTKVIRFHIRRHIGRNLLRCMVCQKEFAIKNHLNRHMLLHPKHGDSFPCEKCDGIFETFNDQKYHVEIAHEITTETNSNRPGDESNNDKSDDDEEEQIDNNSELINGRYQCKLCDKTLANRGTLKLHIRLHLGKKLKKCPTCLHGFSKKSHLDRHLKTHERKKYECKSCMIELQTHQALNAHMSKAHGEPIVTFKCDQCPKTYHQEAHLKSHKKCHLLPKEPKKCDICQKQFSRLDNLKSHMQIHIPREEREVIAKNHLCSYCGIGFANSSNLSVHIRRHTGFKPFACDTCDARFTRSCDLICHRRTHTGEKPYVCSHKGCDKAFSRSNKLVRHIRIHTGEKPYKCDHINCNRAFTQSNDLRLHIRRHTGEKPFVCSCGERFITNSLLQQHRRSQGHADQVIGEIFTSGSHMNSENVQNLIKTDAYAHDDDGF